MKNRKTQAMKSAKKKSRITNRKPKYKQIIWAPLMPSKHNLYVASFFSGVGGFDKGAKKAGFQSLFQSDWWHEAGRAFELNIPSFKTEKNPDYLKSEGIFFAGEKVGDIRKLKFDRIRRYIKFLLKINIKPGELSVIIGGPPCQDYSKCNNHRDINGIRNHLIFPYLRLINAAKPKVALVEQVPDLLGDKFAHIWNKVKLELNTMTDYRWDYKVMNAMEYGARQDRKRLIIMLVRRDLGVPVSFPSATPPNLSKVAVQSLLPDVYHFSPGQYADGIKSAKDNVFCTMTATGSEYVYGLDGVRRDLTIDERMVLTELEGLNLDGICQTSQKRLLGNMVQISFAEALFLHIKKHILKVDD